MFKRGFHFKPQPESLSSEERELLHSPLNFEGLDLT